MKSRSEIKEIGKEAFKANYWNCVLAALLVTAVTGVLTWLSDGEQASQVLAEGESIRLSVSTSAGKLLSFLLNGPLNVGLAGFFLMNLFADREAPTVTVPFSEAFKNYPRKLGTTFLVRLFTFLWCILFIIPGIIKAIAYSMTPYILEDCPEVKAMDAIKLSQRMMNGHKGEYFVMILSFIGWILLSCLTLGLLFIFYVHPYMQSTFAVFYAEVKEDALQRGVISQEELA